MNRTVRGRLAKSLRTLRQAWLQISGMPDYERYLAHMASHHPEEPPLSRRQFVEQAIERRYGKAGPRCC